MYVSGGTEEGAADHNQTELRGETAQARRGTEKEQVKVHIHTYMYMHVLCNSDVLFFTTRPFTHTLFLPVVVFFWGCGLQVVQQTLEEEPE